MKVQPTFTRKGIYKQIVDEINLLADENRRLDMSNPAHYTQVLDNGDKMDLLTDVLDLYAKISANRPVITAGMPNTPPLPVPNAAFKPIRRKHLTLVWSCPAASDQHDKEKVSS